MQAYLGAFSREWVTVKEATSEQNLDLVWMIGMGRGMLSAGNAEWARWCNRLDPESIYIRPGADIEVKDWLGGYLEVGMYLDLGAYEYHFLTNPPPCWLCDIKARDEAEMAKEEGAK